MNEEVCPLCSKLVETYVDLESFRERFHTHPGKILIFSDGTCPSSRAYVAQVPLLHDMLYSIRPSTPTQIPA